MQFDHEYDDFYAQQDWCISKEGDETVRYVPLDVQETILQTEGE